MASEVAQPEAIQTSLPGDAPAINGDHDHTMEDSQSNDNHNAIAFEDNNVTTKADTSLDVNNITADANPAGPTPTEDVAPGITPVTDFVPKDAPTSHPTPPPDEPLIVADANIDAEMKAAEDDVPQAESGPESEQAAPPESSLVRPREDDDEDDEPAAKRSRVEDVAMPDAKPETETATDAPEVTGEPDAPGSADQPLQAEQPESTEQAAAPAPPADAGAAMETPPASAPVSAGSDPVEEKSAPSDAKPADAKPADTVEHSKPAETGQSKHQYSKDPMTQSQMKFLLEKMKNLKKTKNSVAFLNPVDPVALGIPTYPEIIKNPMDLNTMETKLKSNQYSNVQEFADDFDLIISNTRKFNGDTHLITQAGFSMEAYFRKMMETVPSASAPAPVKPQPKKEKASPKPASAPRRESRSAAQPHAPPSMVSQASGAGSVDSFALQADGTPQIRRDSTINRPARAIKPPQNRELTYAKPKRKEHQLELKFCEFVLNELKSPKYGQFNHVFKEPVDPVALNIPHYRQIVKHPMDLATMTQKLKQGQYGKANEFKKDFELMIQNCLSFNPAGNPVRDLGIQFKRNFDAIWLDKDKWEKKRKQETVRAASASADDDSAEEDEEEEEEEAPEDPAGTIRALQKQLADMQNALAGLNGQKKPKKAKSTAKAANKKGGGAAVHKTRQAPPPKQKAPKKVRQVTYEEKQEISEAVNKMNEGQVQDLTQIITQNCQKYADQEEMELEIDDLPNNVQSMLLKYVRGLFGKPTNARAVSPDDAAAMDDDDFEPERGARRGGGGGAASKKKKHKPMGKDQQTAAMQEIKNKLAAFQRAGVSASQSPTNSNNFGMAEDTSGDDESEESEEE